MSDLGYDTLVALQGRCAALLADLGQVTQGAAGLLQEPPPTGIGTPWIDVLVVRAESGESRGGAQTLVVETRLHVTVAGDDWTVVVALARWVTWMCDSRLRADRDLAALFARVVGTSTTDTWGDPGSAPQVSWGTVIRSEMQYIQPVGDIAGLVVTLDAEDREGGIDRGHAVDSNSASLVTFSTQLPQVAPFAPTALYANATAGNTIEVLDADDVVVASAPVTVAPAGALVLPALGAGVYAARLNGARSLATLTITERPA